MSGYGVVLFFTTTSAIRAEKHLRAEGFPVKLIPTPREFSSDCGIALRFEWVDHERIFTLLKGARIEVESIHRWQD